MRPAIALAALLILSGCDDTTASSWKPAKTSDETIKSNWSYETSKDEMRGTTTRVATATSEESFPNIFGVDARHSELSVIRRPKGIEIELSNPNLQYLCNSYSNTRVEVKFDSAPVKAFGCTGARTSTFGTAFILSEAAFLSRLRTSKRVIVEVDVYQKGGVQQSFNVDGLSPEFAASSPTKRQARKSS